jgi:hypothetical protein
MTDLKAIETRYAGCRFRSRLEARWAVFFDTLRISWEYEPQGYEIESLRDGTTRRYLPDFYLPTLKHYVEVKGSDDLADQNYRDMLSSAIDNQDVPLQAILLLGPVPNVENISVVLHARLHRHNGLIQCDSVAFSRVTEGPLTIYYGSGGWLTRVNAPGWPNGATWNARRLRVEDPDENPRLLRQSTSDAYLAARSARFEHGETPTPKSLPSKPPTLGAVVRQQSAADAARDALAGMAAVGRCTDDIIDLLREHSGDELSTRQVIGALRARYGTYHERIIRRALSRAADDHLIERRQGPQATSLWRMSGVDLVIRTFGGSPLVEGEPS